MSKTRVLYSVEELAEKVEVETEPEIDAGIGGAELGMRDAELRLIAVAGGSPSVGSRIPIACTSEKKSQNRILH